MAEGSCSEVEDDLLDGVDRWPTLTSDPPDPNADALLLGERPRAREGSIYLAQAYVPKSINRHLREYQREGVRFLWDQYTTGVGGVLGDEMGLGKTVQTIAFLSAVMSKTAGPADRRRNFPLKADDCKQALLVVPASTIGNWKRELRTWGFFRLAVAHGSEKEAAIASVQARELEVLITTYETVRAHMSTEDFSKHPWEVTIWDEAHKIRNPRSGISQAARDVHARCRFCLTGTPMSNNHKELWSLFDFVSNHRVGTWQEFNMYYSRVLKRGMRRNATQYELRRRVRRQERLKKLIDKWMLQRFKSIIADQMPRKLDQVIFCKLANAQEEAYARAIASPDYQALLRHKEKPCFMCGNSDFGFAECCRLDLEGPIAEAMHPDGEPCDKCPNCLALPALCNLLKIANHLELIKPDPDSGLSESKLQSQMRFAELILGETAGVRNIAYLDRASSEQCGKMGALVPLLRKWKLRKAKVLLFSYSTQMLDILQDFVSSQGYSYLRLDGKTPTEKRTSLVDQFNADESNVFVFLLSTKAGGVGINLVAATVVVIFDPNWNPAHDMQAQDRAYRIGQRHDVTVYRLISSNTVEENIYLRQVYKRTQEHVALRQADEVRFFNAVQGDPKEKGELFGIENLLRFHERRDRSLTREVLQRAAGQRPVNLAGFDDPNAEYIIMHDERQVKSDPKGVAGPEDGVGGKDYVYDDNNAEYGEADEEEAGEDGDDDAAAAELSRSADYFDYEFGLVELLGDELDGIAVHVHRDQDVVGRQRSTGGEGGQLERRKWRSTALVDTEDALNDSRIDDSMVAAVQSCIGGFDSYEDFIEGLHEKVDVAQSVMQCVRHGHGKALESAVNAMRLRGQ